MTNHPNPGCPQRLPQGLLMDLLSFLPHNSSPHPQIQMMPERTPPISESMLDLHQARPLLISRLPSACRHSAPLSQCPFPVEHPCMLTQVSTSTLSLRSIYHLVRWIPALKAQTHPLLTVGTIPSQFSPPSHMYHHHKWNQESTRLVSDQSSPEYPKRPPTLL